MARGPPLPRLEPMAANIEAVGLAKLVQRPETKSWLRWEGSLSPSAGVATVGLAEAEKADRVLWRLLQAPKLTEQALAELLFELVWPPTQLRQSTAKAEERHMPSVGAV